jgi:CO/xanthine dehydrogenase Mo-binding subunit
MASCSEVVETVAFRVIGQPTPRVDGFDKVTGRARYAADFTLPGTLWGKALHSPHAHARILRIDTSAAERMPGVHAVITGADTGDGLYGRIIHDLPVLARDVVRFFGERVAAVAADDEDTAQKALDLIDVEYEVLDAVFDPIEAIAASAPILHPGFNDYPGVTPLETPSNRYHYNVIEKGDVDAGFAAADVVVENTFFTPRQHQAYLEPQNVLVNVEGGRIHVWACGKAPYDLRRAFAATIGVPEDTILINHAYIGGDFGGKATPADLPIAYYLSKAAGRPIRMILDYVEEFMAANPRHATVTRLKTGAKRDGTITAHTVDFYVNCGAYAAYKPLGRIGGAIQAAGPYRLGATRIESTHVYTNTVPGGHMRAPGEPQALFALESQIDEVARAIGMDPLQFRLKNIVAGDDAMPIGEQLHELRGVETLRAAGEASGWSSPKRRNIGRGIAIGDRGPGGGAGNATVTLDPDGGVTLTTAIFEQGTGTYTTLRQVIAEELDITPERVRIDVQNTDGVAYDSGIGGMRGSRMNTATAYEAAQEAKQSLFRLAAEHLGWPLEAQALRGDALHRTDNAETVRWADLLRDAGTTASGASHVEDRARSPITSFCAQVAEVEVDPDTGQVTILKFTTVHDVGQILNPIGHQGQINGGLMQGLGYALMEELRVEDGRVTTLSFGDYKVPTTSDLPELNTVLVESDSGIGLYRIKGIGESSTAPVAPAIANAIADAVGVRLYDLPLTSEKVYAALKANGRA